MTVLVCIHVCVILQLVIALNTLLFINLINLITRITVTWPGPFPDENGRGGDDHDLQNCHKRRHPSKGPHLTLEELLHCLMTSSFVNCRS